MANYIVTGGASGIGLAVARTARARGHSVCVFDRVISDEVRSEFSDCRVLLVAGDVTDQAACTDMVAAAARAFGNIDGVSHNAGIQRYGTAQDTEAATWDEVIAVNLTGAFHVAKAALPELRRSRGSIAFTGSVQSLASQQNVAAYTVAKHGIVGLSSSIAMDFAADGVRSNVVAPGAVKTPMLDWSVSLADDPDAVWGVLNGMHPLGRIARPEEIATAILFLLSPDAAFVTGETLRVDGGLLSQIAGTPREVGT